MADNDANELTIADEIDACHKFSQHLLDAVPQMLHVAKWQMKGDMLTDLSADLRHRVEHGKGLLTEEEERKRGNGCSLLEETVLVADHVQSLSKFSIELPPAVNLYFLNLTVLMRSAAIELHSLVYTGKPTSRYVRSYPASDSLWAYPQEVYDAVPLTPAPEDSKARAAYLSAFPDYAAGQDYLRAFDSGEKSVVERQRLVMRYRRQEVLFRLERELASFTKKTKESEFYGFCGQMNGLVEGGLLKKEKAEELRFLATSVVFGKEHP